MSRRHASKARREARRVRQADRAEYLRTSGTMRERRDFSYIARGGLKLRFVPVGPMVHFDATTDLPRDLPLMVVDEMLRQACPRAPTEPEPDN